MVFILLSGIKNNLTKGKNNDIINMDGDNNLLQKIETGGIRNEQPLTQEQKQVATDFAVKLNMPLNKIAYSDNYYTGYNPEYDILLIGTDLFPIENAPQGIGNANSRVSWRSAMGHELIGHREAALKGWAQSDKALEEAQASIRAARFTPDLSEVERIILLRDAVSRLPVGVKIKDIKDRLNISER